MTILLTSWAVVGSAVAIGARVVLGSSWSRAIWGGFISPTFPALIAISRIRYGLRRRSATCSSGS